MSNDLTLQLFDKQIIIKSGKLNPRFKTKIQKYPELIQLVTEETSYLRYSANLNVRIRCVMQGITEQPRCVGCGAILKMRLDGRYRNTFPTFCGPECFAGNAEVKEKRKNTNLARYGVSNHLNR